MRTILITGGSRGIGAALVRKFAGAGDRVYFTYLRAEAEAMALAEETGAEALRADAASGEQMEQAIRRIEEEAGGIDAVICNAGVSLVKLGDVCRKQLQYRDAVAYLNQAVKIFKRNADVTGSVRYQKNLASALEKLAKAADGFHQRGWADQCYEHALELREELADKSPSHVTRHELATCCFLYAEFNRDVPMMERALQLWAEMLPRHPEYRVYVENAKRMLIRMG